MKRIIFIVLALLLISVVIALGFYTANNPSLVVWFGLATAILSPLAFMLLGQSFKANDQELLAKLSKVPQVRELMEKAQSEEERIRILELERQNLDDTIKVEARRQSLAESKKGLEKELEDKIKQYDAILEELKLLDIEIESSPARDEIKRIQRRLKERKQGRVIVIRIGKKELSWSVSKLGDGPVSLFFIFLLLAIEKIQKKKPNNSIEGTA